ncbi:MAG: four helix bundle protein [Phaeodactylibacter sp.]|nr:four helix bundle protein [Phaeodactylibacter sp.]
MTSKELQERLIRFAVAILKLFRKMPKEPDAIHIAGQFMRSGTHPGIHYGEVRAAESDKDFVHKLKMINKELRETYNFLTIVQLMEYVKPDDIAPVHKECNELIAIFTATIISLESKEYRGRSKR